MSEFRQTDCHLTSQVGLGLGHFRLKRRLLSRGDIQAGNLDSRINRCVTHFTDITQCRQLRCRHTRRVYDGQLGRIDCRCLDNARCCRTCCGCCNTRGAGSHIDRVGQLTACVRFDSFYEVRCRLSEFRQANCHLTSQVGLGLGHFRLKRRLLGRRDIQSGNLDSRINRRVTHLTDITQCRQLRCRHTRRVCDGQLGCIDCRCLDNARCCRTCCGCGNARGTGSHIDRVGQLTACVRFDSFY